MKIFSRWSCAFRARSLPSLQMCTMQLQSQLFQIRCIGSTPLTLEEVTKESMQMVDEHVYEHNNCYNEHDLSQKHIDVPVIESQKDSDTVKSGSRTCDKVVPEEHDDYGEEVTITNLEGEKVDVNPIHTFEELTNLPHWLKKGLQSLKYPSTMGIQKYTIPLLDEGYDVIGLAPTGSGKTIAFAVPALKNLQRNEDNSPSVLVLAPTRELVQQTRQVFSTLSSGAVRIAEAYGGSSREMQARRLHHGCDVLIACPGRIRDFLSTGDVSISKVSFLVFDEADRLLDMGFQIQLDEILSYLNPNAKIQRMMWSATWPNCVQELAKNYLSSNRLMIRAGDAGSGQQVNSHITQNLIFCESFDDRIGKLCELISSGKIDDTVAKLLIFVERQTDTEVAAEALSKRLNISQKYIGVIHGGLPQSTRDRVLQRFKQSHIRLLVATDVASRGLDIPDVTCVINFHAPKTIDSYCHRIGRTGRARREGDAYTFICSRDGGLATSLIDYLAKCKQDVPERLHELAQQFKHMMLKREQFQRKRLHDTRGRGRGRSRERNHFLNRYDDGASYSSRYDDINDMMQI